MLEDDMWSPEAAAAAGLKGKVVGGGDVDNGKEHLGVGEGRKSLLV